MTRCWEPVLTRVGNEAEGLVFSLLDLSSFTAWEVTDHLDLTNRIPRWEKWLTVRLPTKDAQRTIQRATSVSLCYRLARSFCQIRRYEHSSQGRRS